jgi:hypothetical protein
MRLKLPLFMAGIVALVACHSARAQMTTIVGASTYTFQPADCDQQGIKAIVFTNSSGIAATLPQAGGGSQFRAGCTIQVQNLGSGTLTITPVAGTINGGSSLSLSQGQSARIVNSADGQSLGNYYALLGAGAGGSYTLPIATNSTLGGIKPDGTTITVDPSTGVASATGGGGGISGPGTTINGHVPLWNGTTGSALAAGLPVGLTGSSTIVETTSGGLLTASIVPAINLATSGAGGVTGALPLGSIAQGGATTNQVIQWSGSAWVPGTPAGGGNVSNTGTPSSGQIAQWTSSTVIGGLATTGSGNAVLATSPTLVTPALGTPSALVLTNATGLPIGSLVQGGATTNQVIQWNGTTWVPATVSGGSGCATTGCTYTGVINTVGINDTSAATSASLTATGGLVWGGAPLSGGGNGGVVTNLVSYTLPSSGIAIRNRYWFDTVTISSSSSVIDEGFFVGRQFNAPSGGPYTVTTEMNGIHSFLSDLCTTAGSGVCTVGPVLNNSFENFEASTQYEVQHNSTNSFDALQSYTATGSATGVVSMFSAGLTNANTTVGSIANYEVLICKPVSAVSGGSYPTNDYCILDQDPLGAVEILANLTIGSSGATGQATKLYVQGTNARSNPTVAATTEEAEFVTASGSNIMFIDDSNTVRFFGNVTMLGLSAGTQVSCLGLSSANAVVTASCGSGGGAGLGANTFTGTQTITTTGTTVPLSINGPDSAGTFAIIVRNSTPSIIFGLQDNGNASIAGTLTLGTSGTTAGALFFANATSGTIQLFPATGALGSHNIQIPIPTPSTDVLSLLGTAQTITALKQISFNTSGLPGAQTGTLLQMANADGVASRMELDAFGATPFYSTVAFGGTNAAKTTVTSATQIGGYNAFAYNGASVVGPNASFRTFAAQTWSVGANGTYVDIATTPIGSTTLTEVIRFENDGGMTTPGVTGGDKGVGTINAAGLFVNGTAVGSVTWPTTGDIVVSNSTSSPAGIAPGTGVATALATAVTGSGGIVLASAPTIANLTVTGTCTGCTGTGTTITLSPGLTSTVGTQNTGAQTVTNGSTLSLQSVVKLETSNYILDTSSSCVDTGTLPTANGSTSITFSLPASSSACGLAGTSYSLADAAGHGFTVAIAGGATTLTGGGLSGTSAALGAGSSAFCTSTGNSSGVGYVCQVSTVSGSGTVTTTGSPASGNLTAFSGATSITSSNLSGDCTTSGTLAITCTKTSGTAFGTAAVVNTGTTGATIPLLNGSITFSGTNTHTGTETFAAVNGGVNVQSGTTYTTVATDCGKTLLFTNASAITVTIAASIVPASGTACVIGVIEGGASKVSVNGSAVTAASLVSASSYTGTSGTAGSVIDLILTTVSSTATAYLTGQGS